MYELAYYDSQVEYQKRVGEIEKERLTLEREMFAMMRSDKKLQNLKAAKLRSYWQQVCERERKSRERNEELLKDFENMEVKLSALECQTQKLQNMKLRYDEKVKQMYPKWRQKVEIERAKKQLSDRGIKLFQKKDDSFEGEMQEFPYQFTEGNTRPIRSKPVVQAAQNSSLSGTQANNPTPDHIQSNSEKLESNALGSRNSKSDLAQPNLTISQNSQSSDQINMESQGSMHPPPDSFADDSPKRVVYVNTTAPIKPPTGSQNIVHTIPTAVSSIGETDISEASVPSEEADSTRNRKIGAVSDIGSVGSRSPVKQVLSESQTGSNFQVNPSLSTDSRLLEEKPKQKTFNKFSSNASKSYSLSSPVEHVLDDMSPMSTISMKEDKSPVSKSKHEYSLDSMDSRNLLPRQDAPLTENAAYRALLEQHANSNLRSIEIPNAGEESDEDDLENLLSPHSLPDQQQKTQTLMSRDLESLHSDDEDSFDSRKGYQPSAYVPSVPNQSLLNKQEKRKEKAQKDPWETDSDSLSIENVNKVEQDSFDFYD